MARVISRKNELTTILMTSRGINRKGLLSKAERETLEARDRFESTYHSNRLEGNKLTRKEALEAVLSA